MLHLWLTYHLAISFSYSKKKKKHCQLVASMLQGYVRAHYLS